MMARQLLAFNDPNVSVYNANAVAVDALNNQSPLRSRGDGYSSDDNRGFHAAFIVGMGLKIIAKILNPIHRKKSIYG